jgi:hypothetical protein
MIRLFYNLIPYIYRPFLDNIIVKGLNIDYREEELFNYLKVYQYIIKYIKNLDNILYNTELIRDTINTIKSK